MNSNQKKLQQMIKDQTLTLTDEELFLSSAYQKYLSSMAKAATGRYRQGLQTLMEWDTSSGADVAYTDNYKIHINAGNPITQSFPSRMLRSESLAGLNGHETAHLLFTDFTTLGLYLGSMGNGAFYPEPPSFDDQYQTGCEEMLEAMQEKDKAACLTLSRCASHISNILEDIYIEARIPVVTEYVLILKKADSLTVPFSCRQEGCLSVSCTDLQTITWHHLIRMTMESIGGTAALSDLYGLLRDHPKARKNPHYEDRIRATIYEHPDQYLRTAQGCYRLNYAVA